MKSTPILVILLIALAEGSFKNRFSHIRNVITSGGRPGQMRPQQACEGRLEFIELPTNNEVGIKAVGERKGNLRASSKRSYMAKSYGNCCWILYSK